MGKVVDELFKSALLNIKSTIYFMNSIIIIFCTTIYTLNSINKFINSCI